MVITTKPKRRKRKRRRKEVDPTTAVEVQHLNLKKKRKKKAKLWHQCAIVKKEVYQDIVAATSCVSVGTGVVQDTTLNIYPCLNVQTKRNIVLDKEEDIRVVFIVIVI